ncbi:MAG TPA: hypothetical protein VG326_04680 [Tepidisphaeraceae bacterium]|jgi:hypothetical protein|nr:hypothetical protein [Tepidisphaeraceae bacterium]
MATRRSLFIAAVSVGLSVSTFTPLARAQDAAGAQDVETAKHNFIGVINAPSVFVRSAPREDAYPTMKLEKGQNVTVVGMKYKWLKILPPEGSFAYVPKAYVNQRGDGKVGRAAHEVFAKVGSSLNQLKTAPMGKIEEGQDVEIVGDQDEYWKIKPPTGSFLYVNEGMVDPLKALPTPAELTAKGETPSAPAADKLAAANEHTAIGAGPLTTSTPVPEAAIPSTQPSETMTAYNKLEADFKEANERPITDQPIDTLLAGYQELLKQDSLTGSNRKIAEIRVTTLKLRADAKTEFLALRDSQAQAAERQKALVAEREEIQQRIKEKQITMFTAVGTLRASSIQRGDGTLYRLTDPATGRTVAYLRAHDTKYATMLGQFVGVRGTVTIEPALNMKLLENPTDLEAVDPANVNNSIAAQIIPPSLMPSIHSVSTTSD